jgi:hypothetical protein
MQGKAKMNGQWRDCKFNLCGVAHEGGNFIAVFGRRDCNCAETGVCECGADCRCANCPKHGHATQRRGD